MTRDEAAKKWAEASGVSLGRAYGFVNGLEAIGIIKFDIEEEQWWQNTVGDYCAFAKGFDPNTVSGAYWWKVMKEI